MSDKMSDNGNRRRVGLSIDGSARIGGESHWNESVTVGPGDEIVSDGPVAVTVDELLTGGGTSAGVSEELVHEVIGLLDSASGAAESGDAVACRLKAEKARSKLCDALLERSGGRHD